VKVGLSLKEGRSFTEMLKIRSGKEFPSNKDKF
jgi:hypothetical protein